jgi:DNA-binding LytR/AlgR family response regulator
MILKSLIVDDEEIARMGLERYCGDIPFIRIEKSCSSAYEAMAVLREKPIDLVFLDIQMPKLSGLDFLKSLASPPLIIMTTAYPDFALEGFELDVIDYIVKPFSFERFLKACTKAKEYFELKGGHNKPGIAGYFYIKADGKIEKIHTAEILFVEALENYVYVHTARRKYLTLISLKNIGKHLPEDQFIKVQKSFLVALDKIGSVDKNRIIIGQHKIPISRKWKAKVLNTIVANKMIKR